MVHKFMSGNFGWLSYGPEEVLTFPRGLVGFEGEHSWLLLDDGGNGVKWLQSLDDTDLALPVTAPDVVDSAYSVRISEDDLQIVGVEEVGDPKDLVLLVVLNIPGSAPWDLTANLRAPILVNAKTRQGHQIIALDEEYSPQHPVFKKEAKARVERRKTRHVVSC